MKHIANGLLFIPDDPLVLSADIYEMSEGHCRNDVLREAVARLAIEYESAPKSQHRYLYSEEAITDEPCHIGGGAKAQVSRGLLEITHPTSGLNIETREPIRDKTYIPRDCDVYAGLRGRGVRVLVGVSLQDIFEAETFHVVQFPGSQLSTQPDYSK